MNFSRGRKREEPEINFIPLIDLLLVILIFLMVTTTYNRFAELKINLPTASADAPQEKPLEIRVAVNPAGEYLVNQQPVAANALGDALKAAAGGRGWRGSGRDSRHGLACRFCAARKDDFLAQGQPGRVEAGIGLEDGGGGHAVAQG